MGKFAVCADHPSNEFCDDINFLGRLPLKDLSELDRVLNKENDAAKSKTYNRKLIAKSVSMPNLTELVDGGLAFAHYCVTGKEFLRLCTGAIPGTRNYDKQHCKDLQLLPPHT